MNDRDDGDLYEDNNYKDTEDHAVGNGNNTAAINSDKAPHRVNSAPSNIVDENDRLHRTPMRRSCTPASRTSPTTWTTMPPIL
ncbi:MAG: hypothetical protein ACLRWQ_16725 [Flavonifractor plautii]